MRRLGELHVSHTPWFSAHTANGIGVYDADGFALTDSEDGFSLSDAVLIRAAPKLYDAAERYVRFHEESCIHGNRSAQEILADLHKVFQDLQSALAEAAGENGETNGKQ